MNITEAKAEIRTWADSAAAGALDELGRFDALSVNFTGSDLLQRLDVPELRRLRRRWIDDTSAVSFDVMIDAIGLGESHSFETWLHCTRMVDAAKLLHRGKFNPKAFGLLDFGDLFAGCPLDIDVVFGDAEAATKYLERETVADSEIPEVELDKVLGRLTRPSLRVASKFDDAQVYLALTLGVVAEQIESASRDRDRLIIDLSRSGVSLRVVGELAGVSHQTIKNVLADAAARAERDLAEAF